MGKSSHDHLRLRKNGKTNEHSFFSSFDFSYLRIFLRASELIGLIMASELAVSSSASQLGPCALTTIYAMINLCLSLVSGQV